MNVTYKEHAEEQSFLLNVLGTYSDGASALSFERFKYNFKRSLELGRIFGNDRDARLFTSYYKPAMLLWLENNFEIAVSKNRYIYYHDNTNTRKLWKYLDRRGLLDVCQQDWAWFVSHSDNHMPLIHYLITEKGYGVPTQLPYCGCCKSVDEMTRLFNSLEPRFSLLEDMPMFEFYE